MYQATKVSDLAKIGKLKNKSVMILVSWDEETNTYDITTWGKDKKFCKNAAEGGKFFISKMKQQGLIDENSKTQIIEDKNGYL